MTHIELNAAYEEHFKMLDLIAYFLKDSGLTDLADGWLDKGWQQKMFASGIMVDDFHVISYQNDQVSLVENCIVTTRRGETRYSLRPAFEHHHFNRRTFNLTDPESLSHLLEAVKQVLT
jgi:hypothetical protein